MDKNFYQLPPPPPFTGWHLKCFYNMIRFENCTTTEIKKLLKKWNSARDAINALIGNRLFFIIIGNERKDLLQLFYHFSPS